MPLNLLVKVFTAHSTHSVNTGLLFILNHRETRAKSLPLHIVAAPCTAYTTPPCIPTIIKPTPTHKYLRLHDKQNSTCVNMCSTVIFQYRCGCSERVVFECPFSSTANSVSGENLHPRPRRNCPKHHRNQLEKLFPSKTTTLSTSSIPSPHQALSQPSQVKNPILPPTLLCPEIERTKEQKENEATTSLDEACHDCWQRSLRLARRGDDDSTASSAIMIDNEEGIDNPANSRILKEISANRVILPPPRSDSGAALSTVSSSASQA